MRKINLLIAAMIFSGGWRLWAQNLPSPSLEDQEVINIENLYKDEKPAVNPALKKEDSKQKPTTVIPAPNEPKDVVASKPEAINIENLEIKNLTDLTKLSPFSDIVVIQKKFLPKTERYQFFAAGGLTTNSPWFLSLGAKLSLSYNFTERAGIELSGIFLTNSENKVAGELRDNNNIQPEKFVVMKNNINADFVWTPLYGKFSTSSDEIVPFDMYFSIGGGTTGTSSQEGNVPNFHFATGQIFALNKSLAFRWDYSWYFYQATPVQDAAATTAAAKSNYSDLILTAGVSFFFPEAGYR